MIRFEIGFQRRTAYSRTIFKTIEEEDILYSLFGLGKIKRKRIVVEKSKRKLSQKKGRIIFFLNIFLGGTLGHV
jgi:hypothetical protein